MKWIGGRDSWSFLNLQFLLGWCGPNVAVVANAWRDDGDGLRRRGIAVEEFSIVGAVGPAGAEALCAVSIWGPTVMAGIRREIRREFDGDGSHAKNIAVPIHQRAWWRGLDLNFLWLGLRALDLWLGLLRGGAGAEEQKGTDKEDGAKSDFHHSNVVF